MSENWDKNNDVRIAEALERIATAFETFNEAAIQFSYYNGKPTNPHISVATYIEEI